MLPVWDKLYKHGCAVRQTCPRSGKIRKCCTRVSLLKDGWKLRKWQEWMVFLTVELWIGEKKLERALALGAQGNLEQWSSSTTMYITPFFFIVHRLKFKMFLLFNYFISLYANLHILCLPLYRSLHLSPWLKINEIIIIIVVHLCMLTFLELPCNKLICG